jgi:hypothetical protein
MHNHSATEVISDPIAAKRMLATVQANYKGRALSFGLTHCEPSANPALFIDVQGPLGIGRATWWSNGSLFAEALKEADGNSLLSQHLAAPSTVDFVNALDLDVCALLGSPSSTLVSGRT